MTSKMKHVRAHAVRTREPSNTRHLDEQIDRVGTCRLSFHREDGEVVTDEPGNAVRPKVTWWPRWTPRSFPRPTASTFRSLGGSLLTVWLPWMHSAFRKRRATEMKHGKQLERERHTHTQSMRVRTVCVYVRLLF